jgi:sugar/nucleoside kinase (ribokinase family)
MTADALNNKKVLAFGIVVADICCPVIDAIPAQGHLLQVEDIELHCGGCAANVAIGLSKLGVDVSLVGRVGKDIFGTAVKQYLEERGVRTHSVSTTDKFVTSKTVVLTVKGEDRRFIHCFGANKALSAADLMNALSDDIAVVYVGGYLVMPAVDPVETAAALKAARAGGAVVVLDVVLPHVSPDVEIIKKNLEPVLPEADVFAPNEEEAAVITGFKDNRSQAEALLDMGARTVILTRGAKGSYFKSKDEEWEEPPIPIEYIDGAGAGDAFDAGLIFGMLNGLSVKQSMKLASAYGASACRSIGCTTGLLEPQEMHKILRDSRI